MKKVTKKTEFHFEQRPDGEYLYVDDAVAALVESAENENGFPCVAWEVKPQPDLSLDDDVYQALSKRGVICEGDLPREAPSNLQAMRVVAIGQAIRQIRGVKKVLNHKELFV